jgi:hypothetical protein
MSVIFLLSPLFPDIFVNGKNLNRAHRVKFIELIIISGNIAGTNKVFVKFGSSKDFLPETGEITTKSGKIILVYNGINAKNFFEKNGWKYISSYMQCRNGNKTEYYFFIKDI